jgi:hypothetical protein
MERVRGIEPLYEAWEAAVLPLNYTRNRRGFYRDACACFGRDDRDGARSADRVKPCHRLKRRTDPELFAFAVPFEREQGAHQRAGQRGETLI